MEQTDCSETSAYKIQTPGYYPEENVQHTEQGKNVKLRNFSICLYSIFYIQYRHYCNFPPMHVAYLFLHVRITVYLINSKVI